MNGVVTTAWLADYLDVAEMRLLDLRGSFAVYEENHIPGAQFLHIETLRMSESGYPCKMHTLPVLATIFGQLGIGIDTQVVLYATDPNDHLSATYAAWSLAVTGNAHARVLDGGMAKWLTEERPLTQAYPHIVTTPYEAQFDASIFADWRYVRDRLDDPGVMLVDSRTRDSYDGTAGPTMRRGHIPGAVLHNYMWDFGRDGCYLPREELQRRYERQGVTPEKEIITYCVTGREGSANWFILHELLGYPHVRLYQASLTEWAAMPELPMVTGPEPWGEARRAA